MCFPSKIQNCTATEEAENGVLGQRRASGYDDVFSIESGVQEPQPKASLEVPLAGLKREGALGQGPKQEGSLQGMTSWPRCSLTLEH